MAGEQLRVTEGEERGTVVDTDAEVHFGRAATDDVGRLGDDPLLSRRHAKVSRGPGGQLTIEDLGSANGTFVNDERVDSVRTLALGDLVRVGHTVFQVTDASGRVPAKTRLDGDPSPAELGLERGEELLVAGGPAEGRRISLEDELLVGRAMSEDGRLGDDPELSRRHARLARDAGGRLTVEDMGSANGTFVNGERISEARPLAVGDSVRVGGTTLEVVEPGQAGGQAAAAAPTSASPRGAPTSPLGQEPPPPAPQPPPPAPQSPAPQPPPPAPQSPAPQPQSRAPRSRAPDPPRAPAPPPHTPARPPAPEPASGCRWQQERPRGRRVAGLGGSRGGHHRRSGSDLISLDK